MTKNKRQNQTPMPSSSAGRRTKYNWSELRRKGDAVLFPLPEKRVQRVRKSGVIRSSAFSYAKNHGFEVATRFATHPKTNKLVIGVWRL